MDWGCLIFKFLYFESDNGKPCFILRSKEVFCGWGKHKLPRRLRAFCFMCNAFRSTEHVFRPHFCATNYNLSGVMLPTMPHRSTYRRTFSFCLESSFFTISSFDLFRIYSKALSDCCLCIAFFVCATDCELQLLVCFLLCVE